MNSMICENWDPFKKNEREALIKQNGTQTSGRWNPSNFVPKVRVFYEPLIFSDNFQKTEGYKASGDYTR